MLFLSTLDLHTSAPIVCKFDVSVDPLLGPVSVTKFTPLDLLSANSLRVGVSGKGNLELDIETKLQLVSCKWWRETENLARTTT